MADNLDTRGAVAAYLNDKTATTEVGMRHALDVGLAANPDYEAELRKVARDTGVPIDSVRAYPEEAKRQAQMQAIRFNELATQFPRTASFLSGVENAKVAHDDIDNLSATEKALGFFKNTGNALLASVPAFNEGAWGIAQAGAEFGSQYITGPMNGAILPEDPLARAADFFKRQRQASAATKTGLMPRADNVAESGFYSGVQSTGQMLLTLPLAILSGNPELALAPMAGSVAGQAYGQARDQGLSVPAAANFGVSQGAIEYLTEKLPVGKLLGDLNAGTSFLRTLRNQAIAEVPGEQVATALQDLNEWAVLPENKDKTIKDYIEARPGAAAETLIATLVGVGGNVTVGKGVERAANLFGGRLNQAQRAEQGAATIEQLNQLAAASKLRARDADTFEQFVAQATEDAPLQSVFIDAKTLMQSGIADQIAQVSPSVAEQLPAALAAGGDIAIPVAEYTARIAGTEFSQPLLDHLKTEPGGMSRAEAQVFMQNQAEELQAEVERVLSEKQADDTFKVSAEAVKTNIKQQLDTAGRFTSDVNEAYSTLVSNFYAVTGAKLGIAPEQLYGRYPLRVTADRDAGLGNVLEQGGDNLVAIHNLSADNLRHAAELGGLAAPSLAITRKDIAFDSFGDVTLIGDRSLVNPAKNPVFNADVYSPRHPRAKTKVNERKVSAGVDAINALVPDLARGIDAYTYADELQRDGLQGAYNRARYDLAAKLAFAREALGQALPIPTKQVVPQAGQTGGKGLVESEPLASLLNEINLREVNFTDVATSERIAGALYATLFNRNIDRATEKYAARDDMDSVEKNNAVLDEAETLTNRRIKMFTGEHDGKRVMTPEGLTKLYNLQRSAQAEAGMAVDAEVARTEPDLEALLQELNPLVDANLPALRTWIAEKFGAAVGDRYLEQYTRTGNVTRKPYTLENVVKAMTRELRGGEGFSYGVGSARSQGATKFTSIEQMRAAQDRLVAPAEFEQVKAGLNAKFNDIAARIGQAAGRQDFGAMDALSEALGDSYKRGYTMRRALIDNGFENVPADLVDEFQQFATEVVNAGTEYFEAKLQRAVDIGEFKAAAVPEGVDPDVLKILQDAGVQDIRTYKKGDAESRRAAIEGAAASGGLLFQEIPQGARGFFNPETNTIALLKKADLSTFLHESGHFFLETQIDIAAKLVRESTMFGNQMSAGERQLVDDTNALMEWFGLRDVNDWFAMDFEQQRGFHEQFARGFEAYLFEGKAPSIELQGLFQRFRAWLVNIYRELKRLNVELTDEVRGVMDRMVATNEQIQLAEQARSMMPLFTSPEQAGMTVEEFAAYQALGTEATADAIDDLQARGLRDMQWLHNARGREIKKLQKRANALRMQVTTDVRREVMTQPLYRTWQFLTAKMSEQDKAETVEPKKAKSTPNIVDETQDSLFVAIAKLGGIGREEVEATWGFDPKEKAPVPLFGKPVLRREGGRTIDGMLEVLAEHGYLPVDENGKADVRYFEEAFNAEYRGDKQYSTGVDPTILAPDMRAGEDANLNVLTAGRLDMASLRDLSLPDEVISRLKTLRMTAEKGGIHADIVAEMFGFDSGDRMARELALAERPADVINGMVDARMIEQHGELATPDAIERAADSAIHNSARARMIATEANALAKATGQRKILVKAAKDFASAMISRLKIREIRPSQYANAEARAARAAEKASRDGDVATAAAEKRNQLVQNYAAKSAYDAQEEIDKGLRYLKKFNAEGGRKSLSADYLDQIDVLLERFDLRTGQSLTAIDKRKSLVEWVNAQREQGLEPDVPPELLNEAMRKSYKDMAVEEFRGLVDTIKQIEHLGRLKQKLLTAKDQREYDAIVQSITDSINEHANGRRADTRTPTTNLGRALEGMRKFYTSHIKAASLVRIMDGGQDGGQMWEYLIRSANERADQEATARAEATVKLSAILDPVMKRGKMGGKGQFFPSINRSLNREARITIALNVGNEGNLQRLLGGEGWALDRLMPVLESLTADEWQAVQGVWDHFESYRPQIGAKERRIYGKEPDWVEAGSPAIAHIADKLGVPLRGGYYPIKYDPKASQRAEEHSDAEEAKRQMQGAYTSATTRRSFTKSRTEEVVGRPLLYTLAGMYQGVNDVIHDLAWHEWLIDANRLMRSNRIDTAIRTQYGPEVKQQFKSWIQDIAGGDSGANAALDPALGYLRQSVSVAGLGFNVVSALMQPLGLTQSIVRVGAEWIARGVAEYVAGPRDAAKRVNEMSEFMRNRSRTRFRELNELRNQVQDQTAAKQFVQQNAYRLMMAFQSVVDVPTWLGAYSKAIADGNAEDRAVQLADQAVIDSQGGGETKDLSAIERGGPAQKLFTVFYSFMNTALNLVITQGMTEKRKAKLATDMLLLLVVPAVLGQALKDAVTPGGDEDEDWLDFVKKAVGAQIDYLFGLFVIAREFAGAAKIVTGTTEFGAQGYPGPAGVRMIGDVYKLGGQAAQGEIDLPFVKSFVNVAGDLLGLPAAQINRTITGTNALVEGETENPAAVVLGFQR